MTIGIRGKKVGMTRFFNEDGESIPVTVIKIFKSIVSYIKYKNLHGYNAIQTNSIISNNVCLKKLKKILTEYHVSNLEEYQEYQINKIIDLTIFSLNEKISVKGKTIGKGNAGNIKRNLFARGPMSHGSKHHRLQGSLGAGTTPSRVFPGKKMSGRLGFSQQTLKHLEIVEIDYENDYIFLKGSVPGKKNNLLNLIKNYETFNL